MKSLASFYLFSCSLLSFIFMFSIALDTISKDNPIKDGHTLVSAGGNFELGFFSPGNSKNRYIGIWYKNLPKGKEEVWVANTVNPLNDTSDLLTVSSKGIVLVNGNQDVTWSSNSSTSKPVAQLLDTGNFVLKDVSVINPKDYAWQSFDYPGNTCLPGMKLGLNLVTGLYLFLSSWKSSDDPSPGEYVERLDTSGYPQIFLWEGPVIKYSSGIWNGRFFVGGPNLKPNPYYTFEFVNNDKEIYYKYELINTSLPTRVMDNYGGSGCLLWFNKLIDIREFAELDQDLYIRMDASELDEFRPYGEDKNSNHCNYISSCGNHPSWFSIWVERGEQEAKEDMPLFDLMTISAATNDFSSDNIIGEGGFGPVYRWQGKLSTGLEIAVKKLSKHSGQGLQELKNEMNERKGSFSGKIALVLQWEYQGDGYMSPEYAVDGKFSVTSDVFSLGVLLLEIVSGRKNRTFRYPDHHHNLIGHAWLSWNEGKALELIDDCLKESLWNPKC
ncbi:hypothetical protein P3L10_021982 [Capsicum annuum]